MVHHPPRTQDCPNIRLCQTRGEMLQEATLPPHVMVLPSDECMTCCLEFDMNRNHISNSPSAPPFSPNPSEDFEFIPLPQDDVLKLDSKAEKILKKLARAHPKFTSIFPDVPLGLTYTLQE